MSQLVTPSTLKAIKTVRDSQILTGASIMADVRSLYKLHISVRIGDSQAAVDTQKLSKWAASIEKTRPGQPIAISIDGEYLSLTCETSFIRLRSQFDWDACDVDSVSLIERDGFLEVPSVPDKESMRAARAEVAHARKIKAQYRVWEKASGALHAAKSGLEHSTRRYQESLDYLTTHSFDDAVKLAHEVRRGRAISNTVKRVLSETWRINNDRQKVLLDSCEWANDEDKATYARLRAVATRKSGRSREHYMRQLVSDITDAVLARSVSVKATDLVKWSYKCNSFQHHRRNVSTWGRRKAGLLNEIEAAQLAFDEAKALYFELKGGQP